MTLRVEVILRVRMASGNVLAESSTTTAVAAPVEPHRTLTDGEVRHELIDAAAKVNALAESCRQDVTAQLTQRIERIAPDES